MSTSEQNEFVIVDENDSSLPSALNTDEVQQLENENVAGSDKVVTSSSKNSDDDLKETEKPENDQPLSVNVASADQNMEEDKESEERRSPSLPSAVAANLNVEVDIPAEQETEAMQLSPPATDLESSGDVQQPEKSGISKDYTPASPSVASSKDVTESFGSKAEQSTAGPDSSDDSSRPSKKPKVEDQSDVIGSPLTGPVFGVEAPVFGPGASVSPTVPVQQKPLEPSRRDDRKPWEIAKERYMNMDRSEKRKEYRSRQYCEYNEYNFPKAITSDSDQHLNKIAVWRGDITTLEIDAIVNAANERMRGGAGVDGAVHRAAGSMLVKESIACYPDGCKTGEAKITGGYQLPAKYVIHTVGPRDRSPIKLRQCYESVLKLVLEYNIQHVAFPCISTGIFGYPNEDAAIVAFNTVCDWLKANPEFTGRVIFCVFLHEVETIYKNLVKPRVPTSSIIALLDTAPPVPEEPVDPPPVTAEPVTNTSKDSLLGAARRAKQGESSSNGGNKKSDTILCCRQQ